ncbi:MAG TPA: hypothetical protein VML92_00590 [Steroidobacteraceae bacterium]|nr:hypothetical protein [Steroidobacteraceae bacterium]
MNWRIAFIGGGVYFVTAFILSLIVAPFIHSPDTGILVEIYRATAVFWRPELNANPPDASLMFRVLIPSGILAALLGAGIYGLIRPSLTGAAWKRGLKFGGITTVFFIIHSLGFRRVLNLPDEFWIWSIVGSVIVNLGSGAVLGWISQKISPVGSQ